MHRICVAIWETGEWPEEWTFSTFIPLPKKGDLKQCLNYRTIALVSHTSKILLWMILERTRVKTETQTAGEQAGFRQRRVTRDQIINLNAQDKRVSATTLYVLRGLQEGVRLYISLGLFLSSFFRLELRLDLLFEPSSYSAGNS